MRGADGTRTEEDRRKFEVHDIKLSADGENDRRIHVHAGGRVRGAGCGRHEDGGR